MRPDPVVRDADASGSNPHGTVDFGFFSGHLTCVWIHGNRAVVSAAGTDLGLNRPAWGLFEIRDGGAGADDQVNPAESFQGPFDCAAASFQNLFTPPASTVYVYDAR